MIKQTQTLFSMKDGYEYCKKLVSEELIRHGFTVRETAKETEIKEGCCDYAKISLADADGYVILGTVHCTYGLFTLAKNEQKDWYRFKDAFSVKYFKSFRQIRFDSRNMPPQELIDAVQSEGVYPSVTISFTIEKNGCKAKADSTSLIRNGRYAMDCTPLDVAKGRIRDKISRKEGKKGEKEKAPED